MALMKGGQNDLDRMTWTENQYRTAMRNAGYKSLGQGAYRHEQTGYIFHGWTWKKSELVNGEMIEIYSEIWRAWAEVEQTPPPF